MQLSFRLQGRVNNSDLILRVGLNSNAREIGGSDALASGGKRFRRTQNPRLIEPSRASTRRRRAGALRFKPLKRLDFHFRSGSQDEVDSWYRYDSNFGNTLGARLRSVLRAG